MRYEYTAPEALESDWRSGERSGASKLRRELDRHVQELLPMIADGGPVAVQGRVSDYKTWLMTRLAEVLVGGQRVMLLSPQRANRESAVRKVGGTLDAQHIEHPSRTDLCIWDEWRDTVGRVDAKTCKAIPCPYYVDRRADRADRTTDAIHKHVAEDGRVEMDRGTMRRMGERQEMCPYQLYRNARGRTRMDDAVHAMTYAKMFEDGREADSVHADAVLMDEAHTAAADMDLVTHEVDVGAVRRALDGLTGFLADRPTEWARRHHDRMSELMGLLDDWFDRSREGDVSPAGVFGEHTITLGDAFDALERIDGRVIQEVNQKITRGQWGSVESLAEPYRWTETVRSLLSDIKSWRDGDLDFVHIRYQDGADRINRMMFRELEGGDAVPTEDVYALWEERGTHPAIEERWGQLINRHIEAVWAGRRVESAGDGVPASPLGIISSATDARSTVRFSATHNDVSDPGRDAGERRPTRHDIAVAPLRLRSSGDGASSYRGRRSVSPDTPWFRDLVRGAIEASGDDVAVVPINFGNDKKWEGLPVRRVGDDGVGVVPHSRGSIGEKDLERLGVGAVVCGVQVQSPAETARWLINAWDVLSAGAGSAEEVLEAGWRVLAQRAVSGTIQAGGRFSWDATNLVLDNESLLELAGFDYRPATTDDDGFVGEFMRRLRALERSYEGSLADARAARVVRYLDRTDGKSPTMRQAVSEAMRRYDLDRGGAAGVVSSAVESGRLTAEGGSDGVVLSLGDTA